MSRAGCASTSTSSSETRTRVIPAGPQHRSAMAPKFRLFPQSVVALVFDEFDIEFDRDFVAHCYAAGFHHRIIEASEVFAADFGCGQHADFCATLRVLDRVGRAIDIEHDLTRNGVDGEVSHYAELSRSGGLHFGRMELHHRILLYVEELFALQIGISFRFARIDGRTVDG